VLTHHNRAPRITGKEELTIYVCVPSDVVGTGVEAVRPFVRIRFVLLILSALAIAVGGCATSTFEERLSYLDLLRSRGTLTEDEYATMRRRLVESVDLAALQAPPAAVPASPAEPQRVPEPALRAAPAPAPPAEPPRSPEPLSAEWVVGTWRGAHMGTATNFHGEREAVVEFSALGDQLEWRMKRRFVYTDGISVAEAAGTAVVLEDVLEMTGAYLRGRSIFSEGTPVGYRLRRTSDSLEGLSSGGDPLTRALALHRVQAAAAAPVIPVEPGSLVGVWTGTLLAAPRNQSLPIQNSSATLRIFAEANDLRWTLESSSYGEPLTGSGTVIVSGDQVKLLGSYYVPAGGGGQRGVTTGGREIPIEYTARLSGDTLRGGGAGLDQVLQSFQFERGSQ
jgi:hypothetical protein